MQSTRTITLVSLFLELSPITIKNPVGDYVLRDNTRLLVLTEPNSAMDHYTTRLLVSSCNTNALDMEAGVGRD